MSGHVNFKELSKSTIPTLNSFIKKLVDLLPEKQQTKYTDLLSNAKSRRINFLNIIYDIEYDLCQLIIDKIPESDSYFKIINNANDEELKKIFSEYGDTSVINLKTYLIANYIRTGSLHYKSEQITHTPSVKDFEKNLKIMLKPDEVVVSEKGTKKSVPGTKNILGAPPVVVNIEDDIPLIVINGVLSERNKEVLKTYNDKLKKGAINPLKHDKIVKLVDVYNSKPNTHKLNIIIATMSVQSMDIADIAGENLKEINLINMKIDEAVILKEKIESKMSIPDKVTLNQLGNVFNDNRNLANIEAVLNFLRQVSNKLGAVSGVNPVVPPTPKITRTLKKDPPPQREFNFIEIKDIKIRKTNTGILPPSKEAKQIKISLKQFIKEVEKDEFIEDFTTSVKKLLDSKKIFYQRKLVELKKEDAETKAKIMKLREQGVDHKKIEDLFPQKDDIILFIIDVSNLINEIDARLGSLTTNVVKKGLESVLYDSENGLITLVGREDIGDMMASQLYAFSKSHEMFLSSFNNVGLFGSAGVGKTRMAQVMSHVYSSSGILVRKTVKIVSRSDLVAQYIGWTAKATKAILMQTLEGILFIDEAYQLTPCDPFGKPDKGRDFGSEAVTEIVNFVDKYIGMSIVMVAGYEIVMKNCFMASNEGLPRRFPFQLILKDYTDANLTDILLNNVTKRGITIDKETANFIYSLVSKLRSMEPTIFNNQAGDMLNLASVITRNVYSAYNIKWKPNDLNNNIPILMGAFDEFTTLKGYALNLEN